MLGRKVGNSIVKTQLTAFVPGEIYPDNSLIYFDIMPNGTCFSCKNADLACGSDIILNYFKFYMITCFFFMLIYFLCHFLFR